MSSENKTVKECIYLRHSTRNYLLNSGISEDDLKEILNAGLQAPSSKNSQPWFYYIVEDRERIVGVGKIMEETISAQIVEKINSKEPYNLLAMALETARIIKTAPVLMIVCYEKKQHSDVKVGGVEKEHLFYESEMVDCMSIGASVQNMLLMAESLGIDSLWIADILTVQDEVCKYLKIEYQIISAVLFGKAAQSMRYRKSLEEKTKWI